MKKVLLMMVVLFFTTTAFAQSNLPINEKTQKICFQKVIPTQGTPEEVYNRIYGDFMNSYYKNPGSVIQSNDGRIIKGKHHFQVDNGDPVQSKWPWVIYRFTIEVRDGRVRYTLTDFMQKTSSNHPVEEWLDKENPQYQAIWENYLEQIGEFGKDWGEKFEEKLIPEQVIEEEEW